MAPVDSEEPESEVAVVELSGAGEAAVSARRDGRTTSIGAVPLLPPAAPPTLPPPSWPCPLLPMHSTLTLVVVYGCAHKKSAPALATPSKKFIVSAVSFVTYSEMRGRPVLRSGGTQAPAGLIDQQYAGPV